jgi:hypothetical protein
MGEVFAFPVLWTGIVAKNAPPVVCALKGREAVSVGIPSNTGSGVSVSVSMISEYEILFPRLVFDIGLPLCAADISFNALYRDV